MDNYYTTRLVVRTTDELKGAYLAVCKAKGVTASEEIREFMANTVAAALQDDRQVKVLKKQADRKPKVVKLKKQINAKKRSICLALKAPRLRFKPF